MIINAGLENFVPLLSQWKLQEVDDIYDAIDDWGLHTFNCILKDGKEVKATGIADESYSGSCSISIYFDDDTSEVDDVLFWCEVPTAPSKDILEYWSKDKVASAIKSYREQYIAERLKESEK